MSLSQEMKDAITSVRVRAAYQRFTGSRNTITMHTPMLSPTTVRTENTIARKVSVTYVPGGGFDIEEDEFPVATAHQKLDAVRRGYRLHQVEATSDPNDWAWLNRLDGAFTVEYKPSPRGVLADIIPTPKKDRKKDDLDCYRPKPLMSGLPADWVSKGGAL